jgi:hypothetical protein
MIVKRKDFEKTFSKFSIENKKTWAISTVKELHKDVLDVAIRLSELHFVNYVKITDATILASSEAKGTKNKKPITTMDHPTAVGVELSYHTEYRIMQFLEINSPIKGNGSKMVSAVLTNLPKDWRLFVIMDWSGGFWGKMKERHSDREWIISE